MNKIKFSQIIKEEREKRGLSLRKAAERIGCSTFSLQKWEEGQRIPSICFLAQIRELYDLPLSIMVAGL